MKKFGIIFCVIVTIFLVDDLSAQWNYPLIRFFPAAAAGTPVDTCREIVDGLDDMEEYVSSGNADHPSSDIEVGVESGGAQIVGLRWTNLGIPQGATIDSASIQFDIDETGSTTCDLLIYGEDADNAAQFDATNNDVGGRTKTTAVVSWSPPAWDGVPSDRSWKQLTPDIGSLIQEIVDRPGFTSSSAIVVLIVGDVGNTGVRTAESFEGNGVPATLCVYYTN